MRHFYCGTVLLGWFLLVGCVKGLHRHHCISVMTVGRERIVKRDNNFGSIERRNSNLTNLANFNRPIAILIY